MDKNKGLDKLIYDRIETFLGYGDPKSKIWFMGMEEGGREMDKDGKIDGKEAKEYHMDLFKRNRSKTFEDIKNSDWPKGWGGKFDWLYKLLLYLEGKEDAFEKYDEKFKDKFKKNFGKLGRKDNDSSNCFLEFNPVPLREGNIKYFFWNYIENGNYIVKGKSVKNRKRFLESIKDKRLRLLKKQLGLHKPEKMIFYSKRYWEYLSSLADNNKIEEIEIRKEEVRDDGKRQNRVSILFFKYGSTKVFIIPQTSAWGMSPELFKEIGNKINKLK